MANFIFNVAKGRVVELYRRVKVKDPPTSRLVFIPVEYADIESDAVLRDKVSIEDLFDGTTNEQLPMGRKWLSDVDLDPFPAPDNDEDKYEVSIPDVVWVAATGNKIKKVVIAYAPSESADDSAIVPLVAIEGELIPNYKTVTLKGGVFYSAGGALALLYDKHWPHVTTLLNAAGEDSSTKIIDERQRDWTAYGDAQVEVDSGVNSLVFDGTGDYIDTAYVTADMDWWTDDFTIEAVVEAASWSGWSYTEPGVGHFPCLFGNAATGGSTNYWSFGPRTDGSVAFYYYNGTAKLQVSTAKASTGVPQHISMSYVASTGKIYIGLNGTVEEVATKDGTPQSSAATPAVLGRINGTAITGKVYTFRITKGVARYTDNYAAPDAPLPWWGQYDEHFDDVVALLHFDDSGAPRNDVTGRSWSNHGSYSPAGISGDYVAFGAGSLDLTNRGSIVTSSASALNLGSGDFTIEGYLRPVKSGGSKIYGTIVSRRTAGANGWAFAYDNDGSLGFRGKINGTWGEPQVSSGSNAIAWEADMQHVAVSRVGSKLMVFVNGRKLGTTTISGSVDDLHETLRINVADNSSENRGSHYLDEFRMTVGTGRYWNDFTPMPVPFQDSGGP